MQELFNLIYVSGDKIATCVNMFCVVVAMLIIHELCKVLGKLN